MAKMASAQPARKVVAASLGSALATITVWLIETYGGVAMPATVQAAAIVVVTFIVGYMVPPAAADQVVVSTRPAP